MYGTRSSYRLRKEALVGLNWPLADCFIQFADIFLVNKFIVLVVVHYCKILVETEDNGLLS